MSRPVIIRRPRVGSSPPLGVRLEKPLLVLLTDPLEEILSPNIGGNLSQYDPREDSDQARISPGHSLIVEPRDSSNVCEP
ncbi:hypothetical protein FCV25MIE_32960 [Fagus crenata]